MGPRKVATYFRENLSPDQQVQELQNMLALGGPITNLAHGVAVELEIAEHEQLKGPLVESLKMAPKDVVVGYGDRADQNAAQRSEFAGKGPMFARMGQAEASDDD